MRKLAFAICVALLLGLLCMPTGAGQDYELLENGDFEKVSGIWQPYVSSSLEYSDDAHSGSGALKITGRTHWTDFTRQYVTKKLTHYGTGTYRLTAWVKLADADAKPINMQVALGVYTTARDYWFTTDFVQVNANGWTCITKDVSASWAGEIKSAEFYMVTQDGTEGGNFRSVLVDDCSLMILGYDGEPYPTPTTEAPTTEPVTDAPESVTTESVEQTTAAPESTAPESEIVPEEDTTPEAEQGSGSISAQTWVIAGTMAAVALILLCCGIALSVSYARGKRNEASK